MFLKEGACKKCILILSARKKIFLLKNWHFSLRRKQIMKLITFPFSPWLPGIKEPNLQLNFNNFIKFYGLHTGITTFSCSLSFILSFFFFNFWIVSTIILRCFKYFALAVAPEYKALPLYLHRLVFFNYLDLSSLATSSEKPSLIAVSKVVLPHSLLH